MPEESKAAKITRLCREIAERQAELAYLVLGDPRVSVQGIANPDGWTPPVTIR